MDAIGVRVYDIGIGAFNTPRKVGRNEQVEDAVDAVGGHPAPLRLRHGFGDIVGRRGSVERGQHVEDAGTHLRPLLTRLLQCVLRRLDQRCAVVQCMGLGAHREMIRPRVSDGNPLGTGIGVSRCNVMATLAPSIASATPTPRVRPRALAQWLLVVAALVWAMVVVGGITRLTESGLSITEWRPVSGAIPPLTPSDWATAFEAYKHVPQYSAIHGAMTLDQFKFIFFWEWVHRLLGRLIGLAFALPLAWFWVRGAIPAGYKARLIPLLALGALQGAVGWWMVTSGLFAGVAVNHYRLAIHLLLAFTILAGLVWTALDLVALARNPAARPARVTGFAVAVGGVLYIQLLYGAWVAGLHAGLVTQNWPLMSDRFLPTGVDWSHGWSHAFSSDPYLVHFVHRWWAWVAAAALIVLAAHVKRAGVRPASIAIHSTFGLQILLGVATVMSGVNIVLATAHQAVGALLVASVAWGVHAIGHRKPL